MNGQTSLKKPDSSGPKSLGTVEGEQLGPNLDVSKQLSDKDKKELVAWVKTNYDKMKTNRQKVRRQWDFNLEMYGGNQFIQEISGDNTISRLQTPRATKTRNRNVTNRIRPMIRTEITKQTSQKATVTCVPASGEDDDLFAAQNGEAVWQFLYDHLHVQWTMERNAFWTSTCGNGFVKTWWDASKKDAMFKNVLGMPTMGNICIAPVTPYNLFVPDLLIENIEDQCHVFEAYTRTAEWANMFFQGNFAPTLTAKTEIFESQYFQSTGDGDSEPDSVLIIEAYVKPGSYKRLPEGGLITVCADQLVGFVEGMWYSHEEYPYSHTKHVMTGKFYGASVLDDINSLQKEYNATRRQIIESKNRMARPQLLAPIGSMNIEKYTSEPGLIIPYKPALGKPEPLQIQPIPNYVLNEVERIISDMEDISGQHQVSRGMAPGQGVVAATAIAFLQEKDDAIISTTMSSIEQSIAKIARQALTLAVDYWDIPRIIRVAGTDRSFDSFVLKGSDIANSLDVRVEPGSALPESKAARQAFLMDLAQIGAITPQQMLDMMEIGGVQNLVDRMRIDMRVAQRENLRMKRLTSQDVANWNLQKMEEALIGAPGTRDPNTGTPTIDPMLIATYPPIVPVNKWDNHEVHITTHNNYRKSQEFELLPQEVKDQFDKHITIHENYVYMTMTNPQFGAAQMGMPNSAMGMTPEMVTGPQARDPNNMMPGQPGPNQPQAGSNNRPTPKPSPSGINPAMMNNGQANGIGGR